jgi:AcrR family transcriptional regulator
MSRAETANRLLEGAIRLGVAQGVGALSLQGIATTAGVSKALVLYHFGDKPALLAAVVERLGAQSVERLERAMHGQDALQEWQAMMRAEAASGELALLASLSQEAELSGSPAVPEARRARETRAATLAEAMLHTLGLTPRVPAPLLGRVLIRHMDGLVIATARGASTPEELDAELDTFTLALFGLGR